MITLMKKNAPRRKYTRGKAKPMQAVGMKIMA
jgi:hypothetical protein